MIPVIRAAFLIAFCLTCFAFFCSAQTRTIEIKGGNRMRQVQSDDVNSLITLAGNAVVQQGSTIIYADSIAVNQSTGVAECFGNVHINDADSVHTYAQYLKYLGQSRVAYLKRSVKLTDGKGSLLTDDLVYDLAAGVGSYTKGGKVVNGSTVLTSDDATYYTDTKDVYFKKYVHLTDPKYDIKADSMRYNTVRKEAYFISPTRIQNKDGGIINTRNGLYNLETGHAEFYDRTAVSDSNYLITGGRIAFDEKSNVLQVQDRGKIVDSANKVIILGDELYLNRKDNSFLGTRKPVLILYRDNDSTFITADTLFSGMRKYDPGLGKIVEVKDTLNEPITANVAKTPDSIRYFLAFHSVKIFNDSLQSVCDSLYYSTEDSTFRLFRDPIVWNGQSQVTGDTMYLYTQMQKPKRLHVFYNSLVINKEQEDMYNQIGGRNLNAYFNDGNIDYIRVKGSPAESIYYPQDEDSAYVGMNRSKGDLIDIYFRNKELNKVKFVNDVDGTLYPPTQVPDDQKKLRGFKWLEQRRPKSKLEIFE